MKAFLHGLLEVFVNFYASILALCIAVILLFLAATAVERLVYLTVVGFMRLMKSLKGNK